VGVSEGSVASAMAFQTNGAKVEEDEMRNLRDFIFEGLSGRKSDDSMEFELSVCLRYILGSSVLSCPVINSISDLFSTPEISEECVRRSGVVFFPRILSSSFLL